jgi:hypothetical protein
MDRAAYHKDCVAWAEGSLSWEEFLRKWTGRVPDGPRASERPKIDLAPEPEDAEIALFKELMAPETETEPPPLEVSTSHSGRVELRYKNWVRMFRVGQWVRHKGTGELAQLVSEGGAGWWSYLGRWGEGGCPETAIDPVLPRIGELWVKDWCRNDHGGNWVTLAYKWGTTGPSPAEEWAAACGCLHPVNFGRGEGERGL